MARPSLLVPLALAAAAACLGAGLSLPIMHVRWLIVFDQPVSILGGIRALMSSGDIATSCLLLAVSVVFPIAKIAMLFIAWLALRRGRRISAWPAALLRAAGRWSMLDVLVVALVVFAIKAQPLADARIAAAVLPFVAAIGLMAYGGWEIERVRAAREPAGEPGNSLPGKPES
jgi:paraquat-inducible protein A